MGRPPKDPNKVTVDKSQLDSIMARLDAAEAKANASETKAKELEDRIAKGSKQGIETSANRLLNKPQPIEPDPLIVQNSIKVVDKPATINDVMMRDACPFCKKFHAGLPTILDKTQAQKFACRRCGKHWFKWALEPSPFTNELYPYSEALEQGNRKRVEYAERLKMGQKGMPVGLIEGEEDEESIN